MSRFTTITKEEAPSIREIQKQLTIYNPNFKYTRDVLGVPESKIDVPETFIFWQKHPTKKIMRIPRAALQDPEIAKYVNKEPEYIQSEIAKRPKWNKEMKLRPWQEKPVKDIMDNQADLIIAQPGSGKTVMSTYISAHTTPPICIVVHMDFLAKQWKKAFETFTTFKKVVIHENSKLKRSLEADVVIAKVQGLMRLDYESNTKLYDRFQLAIFDEVHTMGSMEFVKVITNFKCRRMGVTATPERTDGFKTYGWSIGNRQTHADSHTERATVIGFDTALGDKIDHNQCVMRTRNGPVINSAKLQNHQYSFEERFELTVEIATTLLNMGRHVLLLSHRREYSTRLFDEIDFEDKELILGGTKVKDHHKKLVVATFHLMKIAFDRPRLDTMINTGIYNAFNDVQQSTGRIERLMDGKPTSIVIDMYEQDENSMNGRPGIIWNTFSKRVKNYTKNGNPIAEQECITVPQMQALIEKL